MNNELQSTRVKSMLIASMLLFFCPFVLQAQPVPLSRSHTINYTTDLTANAPDSLTIIGVRVAFQTDNNRLTTGDGTFSDENLSYLDNEDITIDPLPHDKAYFENHLEFSKNYFKTVSGNQMQVEYRVLDNIYTLPNKMEHYSPTGESFTSEKIAQLISDTWQTIRQQGGIATDTLNPGTTAFVIFHAGVGRDIELTGTNLDKTPQDIPSLFLGKRKLGDLLNIPSFEGFAVNNTGFRITSSIVLPRTLSRPGEDITGQQFVLQLSLNGLLSASIGSYLGLPDLFNTKTGESGIGRFGLMDGESFFSYRGLFPPEPSAWEKVLLGWQSPFPINNTPGDISLAASALHQQNSIAKYSLSGSEYFLVENRHRDPQKNGVTMTIKTADGTSQAQTFTNSDDTFVNQGEGFTELLQAGVVTKVSNYDWSLPGGLDPGPDGEPNTGDDRQLNGGILIWHIDEAVIEQSLPTQTVNANPQRRGVDLEEADGAQDIGRAANSNLSEQARGTAFDFWWKDNNASVITQSGDTLSFYENRFGPDTHPSNESNSGARSFFEFHDFSDATPIATFKVRPLSNAVVTPVSLPVDTLPKAQTYTQPQQNYYHSYPLQLSLHKADTDSFLIAPSRQTTFALQLTESTPPLFDFESGPPQQPYLGSVLILGQKPDKTTLDINAWQWNGTSWDNSWTTNVSSNQAFISSVDDQVLLADFTKQRINITGGSLLSPLPRPTQRTTNANGIYALLSKNLLNIGPDETSYNIAGSPERLFSGTVQLSLDKTGFFLLTDTNFQVFSPDNFSQPKPIIQNTNFDWPAMVDINKDNRLDFLYLNKDTGELEARNINGAMLAHFPIQTPKDAAFVGTPLIAEHKNGKIHIFMTTQSSFGMNIYGYNMKGNILEGFPLYVGGLSDKNDQPIHPLLVGNTLFAVSHRGELKAWQLEEVTNVLWGSKYGPERFNKVSGRLTPPHSVDPTVPSSVLVEKETYNWPNPADEVTNLRFQTTGAGKVSIKIITAGGAIVYDKQLRAAGGAPEEFRVNTKNWSSGLYLAMVTATVNGRKAQKMIKMVVIH